MDVLHEYIGLTVFCRGAVPRGGVCFPVGVLHLLYLIVNQHDEGADDHEDTQGDDQEDRSGEFQNILHL